MCPWVDEKPSVDETTFGVTQDFSDSGLRLIVLTPPQHDQYLVSFLLTPDDAPEYFHFICGIRDERKFAPGMKSIGLLVTELADDKVLSNASRAKLEGLLLEQLSIES